jgi:para-nitrobenzyl esterase
LGGVQQNIAACGGDPARVTIGGQSAGGVACLALMTMPRAEGLFRAAIAMSGAALFSGSPDAGTRMAGEISAGLGCRPVRDELIRFSTEEMVAAQTDAAAGTMGGLGLWVDGEVLPGDPVPAVRSGAGANRPLLVGATQDEAVPGLIGSAGRIDPERFARRMARLGLSERQTAAYRSLLPDAPPWRVLARATTDQMFRLNAARLADARQSAVAPTFAYDFRWPSPALGGFGACHCLDLPFVFDNLDADGVETVAGPGTPQELADRMHRAWVGFIADGDPGWDRYEPPRRAVMVFDADPGPVKEVVDDPLRAEREIWSGA